MLRILKYPKQDSFVCILIPLNKVIIWICLLLDKSNKKGDMTDGKAI